MLKESQKSVSVSLGVLGNDVEIWITFVSYLMGPKLRCLILNPLQQLHEIDIVYPIYKEEGKRQACEGDMTSVRLLCLLNGAAGIKTQVCLASKPSS